MTISEHTLIADIACDVPSSVPVFERHGVEWTTASLHDLTQHIVTTYHDPLRAELPRLELLAARVARIHGAKAPRLLQRIESAIRELSRDLTIHMRKEERLLFRGICGLEYSGECALPLTEAIRVAESEHHRAGTLLAGLRAMTDGFTLPDWACPSTRALYEGLATLESAMHIHAHLENNVLFPQALKLADAMAGSWT
ncbi:MAG TPA: hemerythrin domain-containing protein [Vicinamibacterales bacterium]|jgi:regulator of cell morphogenesis and NO signaling|nr:hemerythrin domain-containing protein [Vicinamibacterales bacterium]